MLVGMGVPLVIRKRIVAVIVIEIAVVAAIAIREMERITTNPLTSSAAILMCMAWWSSRMMAITGVCPFDPSVPGVCVRKGEEGERKGRLWGHGWYRECKGRKGRVLGWDKEKVFKTRSGGYEDKWKNQIEFWQLSSVLYFTVLTFDEGKRAVF
jgi:hypothetical protein